MLGKSNKRISISTRKTNNDLTIVHEVLVGLISLLRLVGVMCGGFYGPWLYLVLTLASLYLAGRTHTSSIPSRLPPHLLPLLEDG